MTKNLKEILDLYRKGDKLREEGVNGRPYPTLLMREVGEEPRNQCWNCLNYWSIQKKHWLPKEEGQKQYVECNWCGAINHF